MHVALWAGGTERFSLALDTVSCSPKGSTYQEGHISIGGRGVAELAIDQICL